MSLGLGMKFGVAFLLIFQKFVKIGVCFWLHEHLYIISIYKQNACSYGRDDIEGMALCVLSVRYMGFIM